MVPAWAARHSGRFLPCRMQVPCHGRTLTARVRVLRLPEGSRPAAEIFTFTRRPAARAALAAGDRGRRSVRRAPARSLSLFERPERLPGASARSVMVSVSESVERTSSFTPRLRTSLARWRRAADRLNAGGRSIVVNDQDVGGMWLSAPSAIALVSFAV